MITQLTCLNKGFNIIFKSNTTPCTVAKTKVRCLKKTFDFKESFLLFNPPSSISQCSSVCFMSNRCVTTPQQTSNKDKANRQITEYLM